MRVLAIAVLLLPLFGCCAHQDPDLLWMGIEGIEIAEGCYIMGDEIYCPPGSGAQHRDVIPLPGPSPFLPISDDCPVGSTEPAADGCNTCTCLGGGLRSCTAMYCGGVVLVENDRE